MSHLHEDEDSDTGSDTDPDQTFGPKHMKNENGVFILQHADMIALVRYVWAGCLLPLNRDDYAGRLRVLSTDINEHTWTYVDPIIDTYTQISGHNTAFRTNVYNVKLMALANSIYNYCEKAGGKDGDSYYTGFMGVGEKYYNELNSGNPDHTKLKKWGDTLKKFTKDLKPDGEALITSCNELITDLSNFQGDCVKDQATLTPSLQNLDTALSDNGGEIDQLKEQIGLDQTDLQNDQKDYDWDMQKVNEAPAYMWIFPIGTIVGGTMIAVYRDKARKMAATMKKLKDKISGEKKTLEADINLAADIQLMHKQAQTILDLVKPAIETLSELMECWNGIVGDLKLVEEMVDNKSTKSLKGDAYDKRHRKKALKAWNTLKKDVNNYRHAAYVSTPEIQSIEAAINQYDV